MASYLCIATLLLFVTSHARVPKVRSRSRRVRALRSRQCAWRPAPRHLCSASGLARGVTRPRGRPAALIALVHGAWGRGSGSRCARCFVTGSGWPISR